MTACTRIANHSPTWITSPLKRSAATTSRMTTRSASPSAMPCPGNQWPTAKVTAARTTPAASYRTCGAEVARSAIASRAGRATRNTSSSTAAAATTTVMAASPAPRIPDAREAATANIAQPAHALATCRNARRTPDRVTAGVAQMPSANSPNALIASKLRSAPGRGDVPSATFTSVLAPTTVTTSIAPCVKRLRTLTPPPGWCQTDRPRCCTPDRGIAQPDVYRVAE